MIIAQAAATYNTITILLLMLILMQHTMPHPRPHTTQARPAHPAHTHTHPRPHPAESLSLPTQRALPLQRHFLCHLKGITTITTSWYGLFINCYHISYRVNRLVLLWYREYCMLLGVCQSRSF